MLSPAMKNEPADDAFFQHILGEQGHRFKRALLALCLITIGLSVPEINFEGLTLFGIKPASTDTHGKLLVFSVLWLLLVYHSMFLAVHAYQDWNDWCFRLLPIRHDTNDFPEIRCTLE
jgi:hypothetical protein